MTNIVGKIGKKNIVQIHNENPKNLLKDNEILVTKNGDETQFAEKVNGKVVDYVRGDKVPDTPNTPVTPTPVEKTGVNPELVSYMAYYGVGSGVTIDSCTFTNDKDEIGKLNLYHVTPTKVEGKFYVSKPSVKVVSGVYRVLSDYSIDNIELELSAKLMDIDGIKSHYPFIVYFDLRGTQPNTNMEANSSNTFITTSFKNVGYSVMMRGIFIADTHGNVINYGYYSDRSHHEAPEYNLFTNIKLTVNIEE